MLNRLVINQLISPASRILQPVIFDLFPPWEVIFKLVALWAQKQLPGNLHTPLSPLSFGCLDHVSASRFP